eukprot:COSAG01_NODE_30_length_36127_cov_41.433234_32_plen_174_part_00
MRACRRELNREHLAALGSFIQAKAAAGTYFGLGQAGRGRDGARVFGERAVPIVCKKIVLADISLCHACSCQEILSVEAARQASGSAGCAAARGVVGWRRGQVALQPPPPPPRRPQRAGGTDTPTAPPHTRLAAWCLGSPSSVAWADEMVADCNVIEAPWLVNGGHGASLRHHQ